jgi:hypothetical protein
LIKSGVFCGEEMKRQREGTVWLTGRRFALQKKIGGLGIKELSMYGRVLRLRWPWYLYEQIERPWKGMMLPCEAKDLKLFTACTKMSIGNGQIASFEKINGWMEWPVAKREKKT